MVVCCALLTGSSAWPQVALPHSHDSSVLWHCVPQAMDTPSLSWPISPEASAALTPALAFLLDPMMIRGAADV